MSKYNQDFWNERYGQKEFVYGEKPNEYLKEKLDSLPVGKILFPAEGEGRNAVYAAKNGWQATAFDQSEEGKKKADVLAKSNNVQIDYTVSEVENINYPEKYFDTLTLIYAHFHSDKRKKHHQKLSSYLRNGGMLILEAFGKSQMENQLKNPTAGGPRDPNMLYDIEELKSDFEGFEFIEQNTITTNLSEGNYHTGEASVVRIFAIKKQ